MKIIPASRRIAILLSGRGSNFGAIADRIGRLELKAEIALVVSNIPDAAGLANAEARGFRTAVIPSRGRSRDEFEADLLGVLQGAGVALICLAGFMRILGPSLIRAFPFGIVNIHPSLLPAFPGMHAQQQALDHGVRFSGCTVHFVDEALDGGPIIAQAVVPVMEGDTPEALGSRILRQEHRIYPEAIDHVLSGRCELHGRRIRIL